MWKVKILFLEKISLFPALACLPQDDPQLIKIIRYKMIILDVKWHYGWHQLMVWSGSKKGVHILFLCTIRFHRKLCCCDKCNFLVSVEIWFGAASYDDITADL